MDELLHNPVEEVDETLLIRNIFDEMKNNEVLMVTAIVVSRLYRFHVGFFSLGQARFRGSGKAYQEIKSTAATNASSRLLRLSCLSGDQSLLFTCAAVDHAPDWSHD